MWSAIVLIVAISVVGKIVAGRRHGRHWHDGEVAPSPVDTAYTRELEREVADLRERVKVLERIATDDRDTKRLASEIEALRD